MESLDNQSSKSHKPFGSPETLQAHYQDTLDHLILMASTSGWKAYAWGRVKELENDPYGFYKGIQDEFLNKIKEK